MGGEDRDRAASLRDGIEPPGKGAAPGEKAQHTLVEPALPRSLLAFFATLDALREDFPAVEELPHTPMSL